MGDNVYMAKLAEQAERYEEMVEYMKQVAKGANEDLSLEERPTLGKSVFVKSPPARACRVRAGHGAA